MQGEHVNLTLIEDSGEEHRTVCQKIFLSQYFNNIKFVEKDPAHLRSVIEYSGKLNPPYSLDGSVAVDIRNNVIQDNQNFATIGIMSGTAMKIEVYEFQQSYGLARLCRKIFSLDDSSLECVRLRELQEKGRVKNAIFEKKRGNKIIDVSGKGLGALITMILSSEKLLLEIDMSPFVVKKS